MTTDQDDVTTTDRTADGGTHGDLAAPSRRRGHPARSRASRPLRAAADALHVRRAFGSPVEQDGVTLVPVAAVWGGAGSGWGSGEIGGQDTRTGDGGGGGFGVRVRPLGVYAVSGSRVQWQPTLDLGRVIAGGQAVVAVVALAVAFGRRRRRR